MKQHRRGLSVFSSKFEETETKDRQTLRKQLIILIMAFIVPISAEASITCKGHFVNPITDICWSCIMPISNTEHYLLNEPNLKKEDIRNITISGIELNIPRNFLIGSSASKNDQDDKSILFTFTYPEIKGGIGNGYDFIQVFCEDLRDYFKAERVTHSQHLVDKYWDDFLDIDKEDEVYKIRYRDFNEDLGRKHYKIVTYGSEINMEEKIKSLREDYEISIERENALRKEWAKFNEKFRKRLSGELKVHYKNVYTNDDPEAPEDYIICDKRRRNTRSFCESAFFYKDLFIKVHFNRKSLEEFNNIKEQTLQLIKQWENINYENK